MTCDGKLKKHNTKTTQSRYIKKHKNALRERERESIMDQSILK